MKADLPKAVHEHRQRIERAISCYTAQHMSNAKWRKLFSLLAEFRIYRMSWRFVASNDCLTTPYAPTSADLLEDGIRDGRFCPFAYREIESITIPAHVEVHDRFGAFTRFHDLPEISASIGAAGQFCTSLDAAGLTIHGYS